MRKGPDSHIENPGPWGSYVVYPSSSEAICSMAATSALFTAP